MKETTVKLSGVAKDRFIERLFAAESALDPAVRNELIERTKAVFTSVRVRKAALKRVPATVAVPTVEPASSAPIEAATTKAASTQSPPPTALLDQPPQPEPSPETPFDPYAIGLVPIFQREGRDGLIAKLGSVASLDHLRQMAKAQQIVLPQALRTGDPTPAALRDAIADAVAKRIADRKAAAR